MEKPLKILYSGMVFVSIIFALLANNSFARGPAIDPIMDIEMNYSKSPTKYFKFKTDTPSKSKKLSDRFSFMPDKLKANNIISNNFSFRAPKKESSINLNMMNFSKNFQFKLTSQTNTQSVFDLSTKQKKISDSTHISPLFFLLFIFALPFGIWLAIMADLKKKKERQMDEEQSNMVNINDKKSADSKEDKKISKAS